MAADFAIPPTFEQRAADLIRDQQFRERSYTLHTMYKYITDFKSLKQEHPDTLEELEALIDKLDKIGNIMCKYRTAIIRNPEQEMQWYQRE